MLFSIAMFIYMDDFYHQEAANLTGCLPICRGSLLEKSKICIILKYDFKLEDI